MVDMRKGSSRIPASKQGRKPCRRFGQMLWPSSGRRWGEALTSMVDMKSLVAVKRSEVKKLKEHDVVLLAVYLN